jgi:hypothetical protein
MKQILTIFIIVLISIVSFASKPQDDRINDSVDISIIVTDFYKWYLTSIKENINGDFQPKFAPDKNGMTTLNYSVYIENLSKYHFSDSLLQNEKESYNDCLNNLKKIKFSEFGKNVYIDLDEYENSNCDFYNYFRWIGGQEPVDGIKITEILIKKEWAKVKFQNYNFDPVKKENYYWGENIVYLIKEGDQWMINNVGSWIELVHKK